MTSDSLERLIDGGADGEFAEIRDNPADLLPAFRIRDVVFQSLSSVRPNGVSKFGNGGCEIGTIETPRLF